MQIRQVSLPLAILDPNQTVQRDEDYLRPTAQCDAHAGEILALAQGLREGNDSDWIFASHLFDLVRNEILFMPAAPPAGGVVGTLERGYGICVDKAHLLVALARAGGMAARYCIVGTRLSAMSEQAGGEAMPNAFRVALGFREARRLRPAGDEGEIHKRPHPRVELRIDGVWLPADPTLGDAEAAGMSLPLPRLGYDPFMLWGSSGTVIERVEELAADHRRWIARRLFCTLACRRGTCANAIMNESRAKGSYVLESEGVEAYLLRMKRFYMPLPVASALADFSPLTEDAG